MKRSILAVVLELIRGRARYLISVPLIVFGAVFALYGVFALAYAGDGSGPTYIKIAGGRMDAHLASGISLAIATVFIASGILAARRGRVGG